MRLFSHSLTEGAPIPGEFAFCVVDPAPGAHLAMSANRNPHLAWDGVPDGTRAFALICTDDDVPSVGDHVNQEGKIVPAALPRVRFFHWVLVDIPADRTEIAAGSHSDGVAARGKPGPTVPGHAGMRHGVNDYTGWFASDAQMAGDYYGYDGPCPPWNDERMHHYRFTLYALDVSRLDLDGRFTGNEALAAMTGHILAEACLTGRYTLNPAVGY